MIGTAEQRNVLDFPDTLLPCNADFESKKSVLDIAKALIKHEG